MLTDEELGAIETFAEDATGVDVTAYIYRRDVLPLVAEVRSLRAALDAIRAEVWRVNASHADDRYVDGMLNIEGIALNRETQT